MYLEFLVASLLYVVIDKNISVFYIITYFKRCKDTNICSSYCHINCSLLSICFQFYLYKNALKVIIYFQGVIYVRFFSVTDYSPFSIFAFSSASASRSPNVVPAATLFITGASSFFTFFARGAFLGSSFASSNVRL